MQLKLYPATLTKAQFEAGAASLCDLPYAITPRISQTINGDWSLSFQYPANGGTGADLMALDMLVRADGQLYRIEDLERGSDRNGNRHTVRAVHLMYDLRNRAIENIETAELTPGGVNQEIALEQVLNGSAFSAGTVDTDIVLDYLNILQKDVMWAIKEQILPQWGGELLPDNWTINIRKQMGADRGVHLRQGKNIKGVRYSESLDGVVTRLHILGYQNANIESINDGKDYIDSANIGLWSTPREDYVTFPDDDLPEDLLSKGTAYLATVDTPRITLSVDLAQVRTSAQYALYKDLETVSLGDTVTVYHSRLGINITARVQSREFNPVTGENYRVELGNDSRNLYSSIASLQQAADITRMIADRNGHVRGERLRGVIDLLTSRLFASGSYVNAVVNDETGILFENTNIESVDYGAMFIGPGIFAIANEKDGTGQWIWRTFGTAGGFYGNELVAASVTANKLASDVGQSLDISSNIAITQVVQDLETANGAISEVVQTAISIESRVTAAETTLGLQGTYIAQNANAITLKANTTIVDALTGRVTLAEGNIVTQAEQIALKADKTVTDGLNTRLNAAELTLTPTAIVSTVRSSAAYTNDLGAKADISALASYSTITQTSAAITLAVSTKLNATDKAVGVLTSYLNIGANQIALLTGGIFTVASGNFSIDASGNVIIKGNVQASSGNIGDFTLSGGEMSYANASEDNYAYIGKWGVKLGALYGSTGLRKFEALSHYHPIYGHLFTTNAIIGVAEFDMSQFIIKSGEIGSRVPKIKMHSSNGWIQTKGSISIEGNFDCPSGVVVAGDWVDFTPGYKGVCAVAELRGVKNNAKGHIDHATLPLSARKKVKLHKKLDDEVKQGKDVEFEEEEVDGRSIGMMVSILTKAIQEVDERLDKIEKRK